MVERMRATPRHSPPTRPDMMGRAGRRRRRARRTGRRDALCVATLCRHHAHCGTPVLQPTGRGGDAPALATDESAAHRLRVCSSAAARLKHASCPTRCALRGAACRHHAHGDTPVGQSTGRDGDAPALAIEARAVVVSLRGRCRWAQTACSVTATRRDARGGQSRLVASAALASRADRRDARSRVQPVLGCALVTFVSQRTDARTRTRKRTCGHGAPRQHNCCGLIELGSAGARGARRSCCGPTRRSRL